MLLPFGFCCGTPPSCLKVIGWGGGVVVAYDILVSAQGPLVLGFGFGGLGPGLDNFVSQRSEPQTCQWILSGNVCFEMEAPF